MLIIKNMYFKLRDKKSLMSYIWLLFTFVYSSYILNLYYLSTLSPDYSRYSKYLNYFNSEVEVINLEQGLAYFFLIYITKVFLYNFITFDQLEEVYTFNDHEFFISLAIQTGNTLLYIIGIVGLYFLIMHFFSFESSSVILVLGMVNFLPQTIYLRATMKPEVLAFAVLPWILLAIEKFIITKQFKYLFLAVPALVLISTTKASIAAMVLAVLLFLYLEEIRKLEIRRVLLLTIIFFLIFSIVYFENYSATNRSLLSRSDLQVEYEELNYNNKAPVSFLYNFRPKNLLENPFKDSQSESWIGIVLTDTFDDYFNLYSNLDYSLLKSSRKEFIQSGNNLTFDNVSQTLTIPISFNLDYARRYVSVLLTASFYFLLYKNRNNRKIFKLTILPIFGILILLINSFGIPENNFDPEVGDTLKTFYYSFLFIISFSFLSVSLLTRVKNIFLRRVLIFLVSFLFLFILGFPKANNDFYDFSLNEHNSKTHSCLINRPILAISSINNTEKTCRKRVNNFCSAYYSIENKFNANNSSVDLIDIENINLQSILYKGELKISVKNLTECEDAFFQGYRLKGIKNGSTIPIMNALVFILFLISNFLMLKRSKKSF